MQPLLETMHVRVLPEHGEGNVHRDGALEDPGGEEEKGESATKSPSAHSCGFICGLSTSHSLKQWSTSLIPLAENTLLPVNLCKHSTDNKN